MIDIFRRGTAIHWTGDYALLSLTAISVWSGLGSGMVIFLAGLQGIPEELEEAARIDGARKMQVFRHVTIPLMTPVIFFQLVLALIHSLQAFAVPMLVYGEGKMSGMPPRAVYLYVVHTYRSIFVFQRFGYGTALLWILFLVILALTLLIFRSAQYWVHYEHEVGGRRE
jgi:multiple sugar transport system permease protein